MPESGVCDLHGAQEMIPLLLHTGQHLFGPTGVGTAQIADLL